MLLPTRWHAGKPIARPVRAAANPNNHFTKQRLL
jgi:hypothetical protein